MHKAVLFVYKKKFTAMEMYSDQSRTSPRPDRKKSGRRPCPRTNWVGFFYALIYVIAECISMKLKFIAEMPPARRS